MARTLGQDDELAGREKHVKDNFGFIDKTMVRARVNVEVEDHVENSLVICSRPRSTG